MKILNNILLINGIKEGIVEQLSHCCSASTIKIMVDKAINMSAIHNFVHISEDGLTLECQTHYDDVYDRYLLEVRLFDIDDSMMESYLEVITDKREISEEKFDDVWSIANWTTIADEAEYSPKLLTWGVKSKSTPGSFVLGVTFPAQTVFDYVSLGRATQGKNDDAQFIDDRGETYLGSDFIRVSEIKSLSEPSKGRFRWNDCNCVTTDCVISDSREFNGTNVFTDLRFDTDNNQFDINFGLLDEDGCSTSSDWSYSTNISFCPYCGRRLPKVI